LLEIQQKIAKKIGFGRKKSIEALNVFTLGPNAKGYTKV
jgi:hypothetical protein